MHDGVGGWNTSLTSSAGKIGIGTTAPAVALDVKGELNVGAIASQGARLSSTAPDNFTLRTFTNTPNPNLTIGYGDGHARVDMTKENMVFNAGNIAITGHPIVLNSDLEVRGTQ